MSVEGAYLSSPSISHTAKEQPQPQITYYDDDAHQIHWISTNLRHGQRCRNGAGGGRLGRYGVSWHKRRWSKGRSRTHKSQNCRCRKSHDDEIVVQSTGLNPESSRKDPFGRHKFQLRHLRTCLSPPRIPIRRQR